MAARAFGRLLTVYAGLHGMEQLALATVPLIAVLTIQATPSTVGALLAAQSAAWLVLSLPGGVLVDRLTSTRVLRAASLLALPRRPARRRPAGW